MSKPNLAVQDYLRDVASKLTSAGFGEKGPIVETACEEWPFCNHFIFLPVNLFAAFMTIHFLPPFG